MSFLNVRLTSMDEEGHLERIHEFVMECLGPKFNRERQTILFTTQPDVTATIKIKFNDEEASDMQFAIQRLIEHNDVPIDGFEDIQHYDYTLSVESSHVDPVQEHLRHLEDYCLRERMNIVDYVCDDIISKQEELDYRLECMETYMDKTSVLDYANFMTSFVDMLSDAGLIDRDKALSALFPVHH